MVCVVDKLAVLVGDVAGDLEGDADDVGVLLIAGLLELVTDIVVVRD